MIVFFATHSMCLSIKTAAFVTTTRSLNLCIKRRGATNFARKCFYRECYREWKEHFLIVNKKKEISTNKLAASLNKFPLKTIEKSMWKQFRSNDNWRASGACQKRAFLASEIFSFRTSLFIVGSFSQVFSCSCRKNHRFSFSFRDFIPFAKTVVVKVIGEEGKVSFSSIRHPCVHRFESFARDFSRQLCAHMHCHGQLEFNWGCFAWVIG